MHCYYVIIYILYDYVFIFMQMNCQWWFVCKKPYVMLFFCLNSLATLKWWQNLEIRFVCWSWGEIHPDSIIRTYLQKYVHCKWWYIAKTTRNFAPCFCWIRIQSTRLLWDKYVVLYLSDIFVSCLHLILKMNLVPS